MDEPCELRSAAEELVERLDIEPRRRLREPDGRPVAAVWPLRRARADTRLYGVPDDIQDRRDEICVAVHLNGEGTILE